MDTTLLDPVLIAGLFGMFTASLSAWAYLAFRQYRYGEILPYEPRRPVPWGSWATLLAVILLVGGATSASRRSDPSNEKDKAAAKVDIAVVDGVALGPPLNEQAEVQKADGEKVDSVEAEEEAKVSKAQGEDDEGLPPNAAMRLAFGMLIQTVIVGMFVFAVATLSGATARDMGLPTTAGEAARDVAIGVLACLAAYIPVYTVQILTALTFGMPDQHPMIKIVRKDPNGLLFAVAIVVAGLVAPLCEELSFRLLLQGWLEKWNGRRRMTVRLDSPQANDGSGALTAGEIRMTNGGVQSATDTVAAVDESIALVPVVGLATAEEAPQSYSSFDIRHSSLSQSWLPIVISAAMFSLAHFGNSTDPIPLFPFALILGFVYQRTHRILPSITAHAMFNSISMLLLARMLYGPMGK